MILAPDTNLMDDGFGRGSWSPALYAAWLHRRFVIPEEAFLRKPFTSAYEDYQHDHPRWLGLSSSR